MQEVRHYYFKILKRKMAYPMKKVLLLLFILCFTTLSFAQIKGKVTVVKDPLIDSLIAKRIELNTKRPSVSNPSVPAIFNGIGYRVQVFYGSDRKEVFNQQARFRALYPRTMTYMTYTEPNYRLKVGDFRTRAEAQAFLNELRANFPTLFIFREKINAPDLDQ